MATTQTSKEYVGTGDGVNGSDLTWTYTFQSYESADIKVKVTDANSAFVDVTNFTIPDWTSAGGTVTFNNTGVNSDVCESTGAPKSNRTIRIYRETDITTGVVGQYDPKVTYVAGSSVKADDLNVNQQQVLNAIHELKDQEKITVNVRNSAITGVKIKDDEIDSQHYAAGSIDLEHMSANSVDSDQYVDGSIDLIHMSANSVDSDQYVDGSIDLVHMSANSVDSDQYVDGSVDLVHLSANSVDSSKIVDGSIVNADISGSAAIDGSKLAASTTSVAGSMSAADKTKLDGIETAATADQTNAEIRAAVEAASDSNVFTDADHTKLDGIATGAEVNVQSDWNASSGDAQILNKPTITAVDATSVNAAGAVMNSDLDTKGELLVGDGVGDPTAITVGTNGYILTADSAEATGVKWAANAGPPGGTGAAEAFKTVSVSGQDNVVADSAADTLTFAAGSNVTITTDASADSVTIASTDTNTQLTEEQVEDFVGGMVTGNTETGITVTYDDTDGTLDFVVASQTDENFTTADHTKLDGIATSANNYVHPNHTGEVTSTADGATVIADDTVDEANLKISNAGTNGQFLQKSATTGGLTWATAGATLSAPSITGTTDVNYSEVVTHTISNWSDDVTYTFTPTACTIGSVNTSGEFTVTIAGSGSPSYSVVASTDSLGLANSAATVKTFSVKLTAPTLNSPADSDTATNVAYTITSTDANDDKLVLDLQSSNFNFVSTSHGSGSKVGNTVEVTGFTTNNPVVTVLITTAATYSVRAKAVKIDGSKPTSDWSAVDSIVIAVPAFSATGGSVTTAGGKTIHTFTSTGNFVTVNQTGTIDYMIVAGGGGGSQGGGGAGGLIHSTSQSISVGTHAVVVGDGGDGSTSPGNSNGTNGGNSSFNGETAIGGGGGDGGGGCDGAVGNSGGSGGGSKRDCGSGGAGTSGQGHAGGSTPSGPYMGAGGGGGKGGAGGNGSGGNSGSETGGGGGGGYTTSISGSSVCYAGGGGGGSANNNGGGNSCGGGNGGTTGGDATDGLGGGGGGDGSGSAGGDGGNGVVIISYTTP